MVSVGGNEKNHLTSSSISGIPQNLKKIQLYSGKYSNVWWASLYLVYILLSPKYSFNINIDYITDLKIITNNQNLLILCDYILSTLATKEWTVHLLSDCF